MPNEAEPSDEAEGTPSIAALKEVPRKMPLFAR